MNFSFRFAISEYHFTNYLQDLIFIVATVIVLVCVAKAQRTKQLAHLRWLLPLTFYTLDQAVTDALAIIYDGSEPEPLNTIADLMDDASLVAFVWALFILWRIIRDMPGSLNMPWAGNNETPEGVWPPAPKA